MGTTSYKYSVMEDSNCVANLDQFKIIRENKPSDYSVQKTSLTIESRYPRQ
jgi:hypothetical protein